MDKLSQMDIKGYFRLDKRIEKTKRHIEYLELSFYNQSFFPQVINGGKEDAARIGFNLEHNVIDHIDIIEKLQDSMCRLNKKKVFFDSYLKNLTNQDRIYLIKKFKYDREAEENIHLDQSVYKEIQEIEEAINFMYGYPQDIKIEYDSTKSMKSTISDVAALLGV